MYRQKDLRYMEGPAQEMEDVYFSCSNTLTSASRHSASRFYTPYFFLFWRICPLHFFLRISAVA